MNYLEELGVECIYLNPIFKAEYNHKYATIDYFQIDPMFGDNELFRELVKTVHQKGIKIILDGVFNHSGIAFPAFQDVLKNQEKSKFRDWFLINRFPVEISSECYECVGAYPYMPKLNTAHPEVRAFILQVMEYWIQEYKIDGWRLDVADEVDESVWLKARILLKQKYPQTLLLGETWGSGLQLMNGLEMDSIMNYTFRDAIRDFIAFARIDALTFHQRMQAMLAKYPDEMNLAMYLVLDSHDTERFLFDCQEDKRKLKLAMIIQMTFPGAPAIYYGDEIGLSGENDPDCRRCMVWQEGEQDHQLLQQYQAMIQLRKQEDCLRKGELTANYVKAGGYGYIRHQSEDAVYTIVNAGDTELEIELPVLKKGWYQDFLSGAQYASEELSESAINQDICDYQASLKLKLPAWEAKVLKIRA